MTGRLGADQRNRLSLSTSVFPGSVEGLSVSLPACLPPPPPVLVWVDENVFTNSITIMADFRKLAGFGRSYPVLGDARMVADWVQPPWPIGLTMSGQGLVVCA